MRCALSLLLSVLAAAVVSACQAQASVPANAPGAPSPVSSAPAPLAAPAGSLATPGAAAASCRDDSECGAHRCNVPAGKCAFPCQTDADCARGATCARGAVGICVSR